MHPKLYITRIVGGRCNHYSKPVRYSDTEIKLPPVSDLTMWSPPRARGWSRASQCPPASPSLLSTPRTRTGGAASSAATWPNPSQTFHSRIQRGLETSSGTSGDLQTSGKVERMMICFTLSRANLMRLWFLVKITVIYRPLKSIHEIKGEMSTIIIEQTTKSGAV